MTLLNPWVLLFLIGMLITSFFTGYKVRGDAEKAKQLEQALAYAGAIVDEQNRVTEASDKAEKDLATARIAARTREARLREELKDAKYSTCVLPDSGRLLFNAAVRDANRSATGQPVESVPASGTTGSTGNDGRPTARVDSKHGLVR